ncbi:PrgI family protein [Candidatus Shapirobacteria bacterium]|nr:PrgI family protein [Candidatus Shapirobacteria bacterium]
MEQCPIPQEISSYEFRLVGSMTLKQFLKLAAGLVFSYLVFRSGLTFILKIPLSLTLLLLGIGTAFIPFNEKPLEFWLLSFFRAAYSPTIFTWKKPFSPQPVAYKALPVPAPVQVFAPSIKTADAGVKASVKKEKPVATAPVTREQPVTPSSEEIIQMIKQGGTPRGEIISTFPEYLKMVLPATPTTPNIINGLVMDSEGRAIEGAIVEIQDLEGNPIRAMRTSFLGQFQTATPLPNGQYLVLVEKDPYAFAIIKIQAEGKIIAPLQIQAKKTALV